MARIQYANPLAKAICKETGSQWSEVGKVNLSVIKTVLSLKIFFFICAYILHFKNPNIGESAELQQQTSPLAAVIDLKLISYYCRS